MKKPDIVAHWGRATCVALFGAMALAACGSAPTSIDVAPTEADVATTESAATTEDGLAEAYALFKQLFVNNGFDQDFTMGFAFHQALSTEKLLGPNGFAVNGVMTLHFASKTISGVVVEAPTNVPFDLWFVKNVAGSGRTVKPESGDQLIKVASSQLIDGTLFFNANIGNSVNFDLDMVVLTRRGQSPTVSRIAVGSRTILEKRFFRERAGKTLDPVTGALANNVETTDALVERGAQLFFNETFAGNGRTCGTCHRAERSLTIDPPFIATLPSTDPLFVAETNPALRALENPTLLRQRGLIRENLDGFEDPTHKFVQRGVPHTLGLATTDGRANGAEFAPQLFLGWGGDGAPGRGTLNEFSFGAIFQHFTKTLSRRPGIDFRIPTQEELDALEAFQMFSGRQKMPVVVNLVPRDASAASGRTLFFGQQAQCTSCHGDLSGGITINNNFATDVAKLTPELPVDDGFDFGTFNVPPLIEAADTPPLFHNNFAADIEAAVAFYVTDTFANSPSGSNLSRIVLNATEQANIAAFLRVINAAENIREVRKRVTFIRTHRSPGNTSLLIAAIADTGDAINVLSAKNLNQAAVSELRDVKKTLEIAQANADPDRAPFMDHALDFLNLAKAQLFSANPDNDF